jgi:hypothetical protein
MELSDILLIAAVILFGLAALGVEVSRVALGWAGAARLAASFLV